MIIALNDDWAYYCYYKINNNNQKGLLYYSSWKKVNFWSIKQIKGFSADEDSAM